MSGKFGFSWSWKRAIGLSSAKAKLSREIGIPLTRAGRERKLGAWLLGDTKHHAHTHSSESRPRSGQSGLGWGLIFFLGALYLYSTLTGSHNETPPVRKPHTHHVR